MPERERLENVIREDRPTYNTTYFAGQFINRTILAIRTKLHVGTIHNIFSSGKPPSIATAKKIAKELNMDYTEFLIALEEYTHQAHPRRAALMERMALAREVRSWRKKAK
jgi:hypothetical protein